MDQDRSLRPAQLARNTVIVLMLVLIAVVALRGLYVLALGLGVGLVAMELTYRAAYRGRQPRG